VGIPGIEVLPHTTGEEVAPEQGESPNLTMVTLAIHGHPALHYGRKQCICHQAANPGCRVPANLHYLLKLEEQNGWRQELRVATTPPHTQILGNQQHTTEQKQHLTGQSQCKVLAVVAANACSVLAEVQGTASLEPPLLHVVQLDS